MYQKQEAQPIIEGLRHDLKNLAGVCLQALETLDETSSSSPAIQDAITLCKTYTRSKKPQAKRKLSKIGELWQSSHTDEGSYLPEDDKVEVATGVLGESLVSVIREEHREPPHVRKRLCHVQQCTHFHLHVLVLF